MPTNNNERQQREAEYKRDWINQHDKADEIVVDAESKNIVAAIYYYPPAHHKAEQQRIWEAIGARVRIAELEEMENEL